MRSKIRDGIALAMMLLAVHLPAAGLQQMHNQLPRAAATLAPLGRLPGTQRLHLALGLPLRNQAALSNLLQQLYDPSSPNYHRFLTPQQFAGQFGPTPEDYAAVEAFARSNGFAVSARHPNRVLLDVEGSVADIEKALHVHMNSYQHPTESRTFYAPDTEPSLDLSVPLAGISGLDNYSRPQPRLVARPLTQSSSATPNAGSGFHGTYMGKDFRAAYVPGSTLTGAGQSVGLLQFDGYTASDITYYETLAGLPNVPLVNVLLDEFNGQPSPFGGQLEVSLDIEASISMAPNLSSVIVYMAGPFGNFHDILNRMATDDLAKQLSCSWFIRNGPADPMADGIFQQMAAQGQSFMAAAGDSGAYSGLIPFPDDSPYITMVGGTMLTTTGPGGAWASETTWSPTGGGISTQYPIPSWQTPVSMAANYGSTIMRNIPDVALTSDNVYVRAEGTDWVVGGTSCAAPLWAGFTALINQQALQNGQPVMGFLNPAVYKLGSSSGYGPAFHDINTGNNGSPTHFPAVPGFDLCTGWGTPVGQPLIDALAPPDTLIISPHTGFASLGAVGGPFSIITQNFTLTNTSGAPLTWAVGDPAAWLAPSSGGGVLPTGGVTNLVVSLNTASSNLLPGLYTANLAVTNLSHSNFVHLLPFSLLVHDPLVISPTNGFNSAGPVGGPFSVTSLNLSLTNSGLAPVNWALSNNTSWLDVSASSGTLAVSGATNITVSLDPSADTLPANLYSAGIVFSNLTGGFTQNVPFSLQSGLLPLQNEGFELGNFVGWNVTGNSVGMLVTSNMAYVHSGVYGAELGPEGSPGQLGQTLATSPGQVYLISFWLENQGVTTVNDFQVDWNGATVFDEANMGPFAWTNIQILVGATGASSVLQFGARNDDGNFGLDDVQVFQSSVVGTPPTITAQPTNETLTAGWIATFTTAATGIEPIYYQWQLGGSNVTGATNPVLLISPVTTGEAGNYRVVASNAFGAVNSSNAVLTVNVPVCDPPAAGLVSWWAGEGNAADSFGTNNGTLVGGVTFTSGEAAQAFNFNGGNQYVMIPNTPGLNVNNQFTIDCWINYAPSNSLNPGYVGIVDSDFYGIEWAPGTSGFYVYLSVDNGVSYIQTTQANSGEMTFPPDQWHHVAATYDGTKLQMYLDGQPWGNSVAASGNISPMRAGSFVTIGSENGRYCACGSRYYKGLLDEVDIFNRALSATEIQAIYNAGSAGKCPAPPVIVSQPQSQTVYAGGTAAFSVGAAGSQPLTYLWSVNQSNIPLATNATLLLTNVQSAQSGNSYSVIVSNADGSTNSSAAVLIVPPAGTCDPSPAGLVSWWAAEGNANDSFGTNNGTLSGGVTFTGGEVGQAFNLDGASGTVVVPDSSSLRLSNQFTIEAWINTHITTGDQSILAKVGNPGGIGLTGYQLALHNSELHGLFNSSAGQAWPNFVVQTAIPIATGTWEHVAWTYDQSAMILYFNGQPVVTNVIGPQGIGISTNNVRIGGDDGNNAYFNGLIDEASVYNTALSAAQIQAIYAAGSAGKCPAPPVITGQPQNETVLPGGTAEFTVNTTGSQPLAYQWYINQTSISMATNASLVVTNVQLDQTGGDYSVLISNAVGSTNSLGAVLTVSPPGTCDPPAAGLVSWWAGEGNAADSFGTNNGTLVGGVTFTSGEAAQAFNFNGGNQYVMIPNTPGLNVNNQFTIDCWINYAPSNSLNPGYVGIVDSDFYGIEWAPGTSGFYVYLSVDNGVSYIQTTQANSGEMTFPPDQWHHVAATYDGTKLQMYLDGQPWGNSVAASGNVSPMRAGSFVTIGSENGRYCACGSRYYKGLLDEVDIFNRALSATEIQAIYNAGSAGKCPPEAPPRISLQPANASAVLGSTTDFNVGATGTLPLSYQWQLNHSNIPASANSTATNPVLVLTNVQAVEAGNYSVVVSNFFGSTNSSNALLTPLFPPTITRQPHTQLAQPGCTVAFSAAATGNGTLTYQWQENGTNLPGQTSTNLALLNVQPPEFGNYTMIASNAYGSATSAVAVLALDHLPVPGGIIAQRFPGAGVRLNTIDILAQATDADGDALSLVNVSTGSVEGGTVTLVGPSIYYLPPTGLTNADAFNYTISDGRCDGTSVGTILVTVRTDLNPISRASIFQPGNGSVEVFFDGEPGVAYRVQSTDILAPPDWRDVTNLSANQYGTFLYVDWPATNGPVRYFRSVTP